MSPKQRIKYGIKVVVANLLFISGVLWLWHIFVFRHKAVVLMYHRVLTRDERERTGSHPGIIVSCESFAKQMAFLQRRFKVLNLDEFASHMERRQAFPNASCLVTFDDGWKDNFTNAMPVLRRFDLPAVIFLPVNYIGGQRLFWQEALVHLAVSAVRTVRTDPSRAPRVRGLLEALHIESVLDIQDPDPRPAIIRTVSRQKGTSPAGMETTLRALQTELYGTSNEEQSVDGFLAWAEVDVMSRQGITFAAHGADHQLLTYVSPDQARYEIKTSMDVISRRFEEAVPAFSYPNGYHTPDVVATVRDTGYRLAFITSRGLVSCEDDRFTIHRLNIHESVTGSTPMFWARLVGLF